MMRILARTRSLPALALLVLGALGFGGCVERKITFVSDPPGAVVWLNDVEVGRTPVTVPFLWYGDYDVRLRLDKNVGTPDVPQIEQYHLHTHRVAEAPPYQWLGIDLFAEILPVTFKDEKVWAFDVPKAPNPSDEELVARAKQVKAQLDQPVSLKKSQKKP